MVHPRTRHRAYGQRPKNFSAESVRTIPRRENPFCCGRQRFRQRQLPESHLDHHVPLLALLRLPRRRIQERQSLGAIMAEHESREQKTTEQSPANSKLIDLRQDRREWLKTSAAALSASLLPLPAIAAENPQSATPTQAAPAQAPAATATAGTKSAARFFTPAQHRLVDELCETIIPADSHSGGAKAARVADYIDKFLAQSFDET